MSSIWLLILVLIVLLIVGTSIFLYLVLRKSRQMTSTVDPGADPGADEEQTPAEFLQYSSNLDLRTSFSRALRLLKNYVTGRDYRYRVPWFLMIGESDSGKTTVLKGTGHNLSGEALEVSKQQLNWF